ncbi:MAG: MBL fold metallo-hydrolase [Nocardioides sp.]
MRLTVVGCSGSYPGPDSPASCYLVEADAADGRTWRILLDLGNGALGTLHQYADPLAIDAVFLSHLHPDHCLDLCGYYVLRKHHPDGARPRMPVWGPDGTAERMARAYDLDPVPGMSEQFDFRAYDEPVELGPFGVEAIRVDHPVPAYGLRVTAHGRTLAYTGDTGPCDALQTLATGADLLLAEASFHHGRHNPPALHLTGREAGETATRAGVRRLVITHVPPWYSRDDMGAEAVAAFDGEVTLATSGRVLRV